MQKGTKVKIIGDRYGNNASLDVPENLGKEGVLTTSPMPGFWWVTVTTGEDILVCETEIKEISEVP